jgi:hypothetical protein
MFEHLIVGPKTRTETDAKDSINIHRACSGALFLSLPLSLCLSLPLPLCLLSHPFSLSLRLCSSEKFEAIMGVPRGGQEGALAPPYTGQNSMFFDFFE